MTTVLILICDPFAVATPCMLIMSICEFGGNPLKLHMPPNTSMRSNRSKKLVAMA